MPRRICEPEALEQLERAIAAAKRDPHGGKVLLPLDVAEAIHRDLASPVKTLEGVLGPLVRGRRVALLGSAPNGGEMPRGVDLIASANAGHAGFGLEKVDLLFLNSFSLKGQREIHAAVQDGLVNLSCDTLVFVDAAELGTAPDLGQSQTVTITRDERPALLRWLTGRDYPERAAGSGVPSTGMTAALILRKLGADVRLAGFSLDDGHALLPGWRKGHREQDAGFMGLFRP